MTAGIAFVLVAWALAASGWGIYWRNQAENVLDENFALRFGASPVAGAEGEPITPLVVTPVGNGGLDDLILEALMPAPRFPTQRTPGDAS